MDNVVERETYKQEDAGLQECIIGTILVATSTVALALNIGRFQP